MFDDPNLTDMDARAFVVAAIFGFACGLAIPRQGNDRKIVLATLVLVTILGIGAWLWSDDPLAGPSMAVGGATCLFGASITRFRPTRQGTRP